MTPSKYKNISASGVVSAQSGTVRGILVNSHTSGTIKLWDNPTAGSGTVFANTITLAVGERWIPLFEGNFNTGLFCTIGGTADITIFYS